MYSSQTCLSAGFVLTLVGAFIYQRTNRSLTDNELKAYKLVQERGYKRPRFELLSAHLARQRGETGERLYKVVLCDQDVAAERNYPNKHLAHKKAKFRLWVSLERKVVRKDERDMTPEELAGIYDECYGEN